MVPKNRIELKKNGKNYEIIFMEPSSIKDFEYTANILQNVFKANIIQKLETFDQIYWDLKVDNEVVILHWDSFAGTSLYSKKIFFRKKVNKLIQNIALHLEAVLPTHSTY